MPESLTDRERLFFEIFLNLPDPILIWKQDTDSTIRLMMANPAGGHFTQERVEDIVGLSVEDYYQQNPSVSAQIQETLVNETPHKVEMPLILRTSAEEKWVQAEFIPLNKHYVINIIRDMSAIRNQQQAEASSRRELELLRQAISAFTSVLNTEQVLESVMQYLGRIIELDRAILYVIDQDQLRILASRGFPPGIAETDHTIPLENPQFIAVNRTRFPIFLSDASNYKPFKKLGHLNQGRSWLGVPLFGHARLIGYLSIYHDKPGLYAKVQAELAQIFGSEASIAIENARLFEQAQKMAITDSLTNFYNRRYFIELANLEIRRSRRYGSPLTLIMFDIDDFKSINDRFGHLAGDRVLVNLCECFRNGTRDSDILGRYGGDEFVILMPETRLDQAAEAIERLRAQLATCLEPIGEPAAHVTVSVGLAQYCEPCKDIDELLRRADQALYQAKQAGRDCYRLYLEDEVE